MCHNCEKCIFAEQSFWGYLCKVRNTNHLIYRECRLTDNNGNSLYGRENEYLELCEDGEVFEIPKTIDRRTVSFSNLYDGNVFVTYNPHYVTSVSSTISNSTSAGTVSYYTRGRYY